MLTYNFCVTISAAGLELGLSFQGWSIPVQGVPHLSLPTQHRTWDILICTYCIMLSRYRVYRTSPSLLNTEHGTYCTVLNGICMLCSPVVQRVPYFNSLFMLSNGFCRIPDIRLFSLPTYISQTNFGEKTSFTLLTHS